MLVIFDCDGVLINSEEMAIESDCAYLARYGLHFTKLDYAAFSSGLVKEALINKIDALHRETHGTPLPADFVDGLEEHYRKEVYPKICAMDGIVPLLEMLAEEGVPFCVASNSELDSLHAKLLLTALHHHFSPYIYSKDMVALPKPAPDLFLFAAEEKGFKPSQCIVVEDSITGLKAGKAAGMTVIGFTGGMHRPADYAEVMKRAGADETAQTMQEMKTILKNRIAPPRPSLGAQPQAPSPF